MIFCIYFKVLRVMNLITTYVYMCYVCNTYINSLSIYPKVRLEEVYVKLFLSTEICYFNYFSSLYVTYCTLFLKLFFKKEYDPEIVLFLVYVLMLCQVLNDIYNI